MATWYSDAYPELEDLTKNRGREASIKALGIAGEGTKESPYSQQGVATPAVPLTPKDKIQMDLHDKLYNAVPQGVFDRVLNLFGPRSANAQERTPAPELAVSHGPGTSALPTVPYWQTPEGQAMMRNRAIPTTAGARYYQALNRRQDMQDILNMVPNRLARGGEVIDMRQTGQDTFAPYEPGPYSATATPPPPATTDEGLRYNLPALSALPAMPEAPRFQRDEEMMGMIRDIYKTLSKPYTEDVMGRRGGSMQTIFKGGFIPRYQKALLEEFAKIPAMLSGEEARIGERVYGTQAGLWGHQLGAREQERATGVRAAMLPFEIQKTLAETRRPLVTQGYEGAEHVTRSWTPDKGWEVIGRGALPREQMTPQEQLMVHTLGPMLSAYVKAAEESLKPEERQYWLDKAAAVESKIFGANAPNIAGTTSNAGKLTLDQYKTMIQTKAKAANQPMPSDDEIKKAYQSRFGG